VHDFLANPMWSSLTTTHAAFAQTSGPLKRFAPEVAPFCAVEHAGCALGAADCLRAGEAVFFIGTAPALPADWTVESRFVVLQMVYDGGRAPADLPDADAAALGPQDAPAMLALTALAYPEFFRPRTAELGNYIGVRGAQGLAAMAGQRLACTGYREISAVVTHPAHRGHGHAGRLIRQLTRMILAEGRTPFLHVSASNKSAWTLYENLGFVPTRELDSVKVRVG
jgi:ribosomal protein S18 acetylase RimI-like enzyme